MYSIAQNVDHPTSSASTTSALYETKVLDSKVKSTDDRRTKLRLHAGKTTLNVWVTVPANTLWCLERSDSVVHAEVEIDRKKKFVYTKIRFPLGDARNEWFLLDSKE